MESPSLEQRNPTRSVQSNPNRKSESDPVVEPICGSDPRPKVEPGIWDAECVETRVYYDRQFRRWVCRLRFSLLETGEKLVGFLNLGGGDKPRPGPRSEYRRAWIIATGRQPRKRERMPDKVFAGKLFEVEVKDITKRFDQSNHSEAEIYSTVKRILRRMA